MANTMVLKALLLSCAAISVFGHRQLLQQTSCPAGCDTTVGACVFDSTSAFYRCTKCLNNRVPAADGSCGCATGFYLVNNPATCTKCPVGSYCPGGIATKSVIYSCNWASNDTTVGLTTKDERSTSRAACVLKPGRFWLNQNTQMQQPEPTTSICLQNSWCPGGVHPNGDGRKPCDRIASGLWTKGLGAVAPSQCAIPPGHYFSAAANTTVKCANGDAANPNGFYQPNWVQYTGVATACTACGAGILSADLESLNIFRPSDVGSTTGSPSETLLVPMTSDSCYIRRGQGMVLAPGSNVSKPIYMAVTCDTNNYGTNGTDQGILMKLTVTECKTCPKYTTTMDRTTATNFPTRYFYDTTTGGFYDPLACLTQPGYSFDGYQATPCPKGEYNDAIGDDANKCSVCPIDGTTTYSEGSQSAADCKYVLPGWQFPNAANPAASLSKCDYGFFSPIDREIRANNASGACTACPNGKTTREIGSPSDDRCDICPAGQGIAEGGSSCQLCPSGFYGDEARTAGNFTCERCPAGSNIYRFRFQSGPSSTSDNLFTSAVVTKPGASSVGQCSVEFGQVEDGNWKLTSSGSNVAGNSADLDACVASCKANPECQFLNYDYAGDTATRCQLRVSTARTIGTTLLAYKVVPNSNLLAASMGSGLFSWWVDDAAAEVGIYVNTIATSSMADCVSTCTLKSECAAVRMDGYSSSAKTITSCTLLKGAVTMTETVRTLVRTRIDNDISITAGPAPAP
ncbi:hypothetical protein OEZ86_011970 [Tetradesmus obliquus]|nr:hypothetical protein OEZ86_011970 [Tetradesmus obliquus]